MHSAKALQTRCESTVWLSHVPSCSPSEAVWSNSKEGERKQKVCLHSASQSAKVLIDMERMTEESLPPKIFFHYLVLLTFNMVLSINSRNNISEYKGEGVEVADWNTVALLSSLSFYLRNYRNYPEKRKHFVGDLLSLLAVSNYLCQDI